MPTELTASRATLEALVSFAVFMSQAINPDTSHLQMLYTTMNLRVLPQKFPLPRLASDPTVSEILQHHDKHLSLLPSKPSLIKCTPSRRPGSRCLIVHMVLIPDHLSPSIKTLKFWPIGRQGVAAERYTTHIGTCCPRLMNIPGHLTSYCAISSACGITAAKQATSTRQGRPAFS